MCASWGLSPTYLPFLKRTLEFYSCPRLVPVPARASEVWAIQARSSFQGHSGLSRFTRQFPGLITP